MEHTVSKKRYFKDLVDVILAATGLLLIIPLYQRVLIPLRGMIGVVELEVLKGSQGALNIIIDVLVYAAVPLIYLLVLSVYLTVRWSRKVPMAHGPANIPEPD